MLSAYKSPLLKLSLTRRIIHVFNKKCLEYLFSYLPAIPPPPTHHPHSKVLGEGQNSKGKKKKHSYLWEHSVQLDYSIGREDILNSLSCTPDECGC